MFTSLDNINRHIVSKINKNNDCVLGITARLIVKGMDLTELVIRIPHLSWGIH